MPEAPQSTTETESNNVLRFEHKLSEHPSLQHGHHDLGPIKPTVFQAFKDYSKALDFDEVLSIVPQDYHDRDFTELLYNPGYTPDSPQETAALKVLHLRFRADEVIKAMNKLMQVDPIRYLEYILSRQAIERSNAR